MTHDVIAITPVCTDGTGASLQNGARITFSQTAVGAAWPSGQAGPLSQAGSTSSLATVYASRIWVLPVGAGVCLRFGISAAMTASASIVDYTVASGVKELINRPIIGGVWATHFSVVAEDNATTGRLRYGIQQFAGKDGL